MREIVLFFVFLVHALVFGRLYVRRGKRIFHLLFVVAFVLLASFQATSLMYPEEGWSGFLRYAAWVLLAPATGLLLFDRFGRPRSR